MDRNGDPTAAVCFTTGAGEAKQIGGKGPPGTRGRFPQVSADLRTRWCSSNLKIDLMDAVIRNDDRFLSRKTLVITGE